MQWSDKDEACRLLMEHLESRVFNFFYDSPMENGQISKECRGHGKVEQILKETFGRLDCLEDKVRRALEENLDQEKLLELLNKVKYFYERENGQSDELQYFVEPAKEPWKPSTVCFISDASHQYLTVNGDCKLQSGKRSLAEAFRKHCSEQGNCDEPTLEGSRKSSDSEK